MRNNFSTHLYPITSIGLNRKMVFLITNITGFITKGLKNEDYIPPAFSSFSLVLIVD